MKKLIHIFFGELEGNYCAVAQNNLQLCAYLKVGMDNNEIAQASSITIAEVSNGVTRLKKIRAYGQIKIHEHFYALLGRM